MEKWLWRMAIVKLSKRFVQIVVAWIIGHNIARFGIKIDEVQLSAAIWAGLEYLRSWLKGKTKLVWL